MGLVRGPSSMTSYPTTMDQNSNPMFTLFNKIPLKRKKENNMYFTNEIEKPLNYSTTIPSSSIVAKILKIMNTMQPNSYSSRKENQPE